MYIYLYLYIYICIYIYIYIYIHTYILTTYIEKRFFRVDMKYYFYKVQKIR